MHKINPDDNEELLLDAFSDAEALKQSLSSHSSTEHIRDVSQRYKIISLLREGTLKKVYLAHDEYMDREVALAKIKDEKYLDDFFNEARLASKLEHPYIAPIYDTGFDESGQAFFAMKLYEGDNLYEILRNKSSRDPDVSWILNIFLKVCEAVAYAHGQGILHLDIKPSNIRIDNFGEVLLCDWGISRIIGSHEKFNDQALAVPIMSRATLIGELRGTPGFMAPEQFNKNKVLDERADIYGLGALLHDMLTGQVPNKKIDLGSLSIPSEIKYICSKALNEKAENRYKSVPLLMADIVNFNKGLVLSAERSRPLTVLYKWVKRKKKLIIGLGLNLLLIVAIIINYFNDIHTLLNLLPSNSSYDFEILLTNSLTVSNSFFY